MRGLDFTSWESLLATLVSLALFALVGVGLRLVMMMTFQQRRERMNRQINERLRTLMAAYKTLGGSFTGDLRVDPSHLRDLRRRTASADAPQDGPPPGQPMDLAEGSDRTRRIRDAVEAALSDIILLGTEEQVRLAERAARELVNGKPVPTQDLVVSLRAFIRKALDLEPIPADIDIPMQGPARPSGGAGGRGGREGGGGGGGGGSGGGGVGMGMGAGGLGLGAGSRGVGDPDAGRD